MCPALSCPGALINDVPGPGGWHLNVVTLLTALEFAADRHRNQKRKDAEGSPYVNHLIAVTRILAAEGGIDDEAALLAKQKEISGIRGELEAAMLRHRLAVGNMLTPEQREHLKEHRRGDFAAGPGFSGNHRMEGAGRGMRGHRGGNFMNHRRGMRGGCSCNR